MGERSEWRPPRRRSKLATGYVTPEKAAKIRERIEATHYPIIIAVDTLLPVTRGEQRAVLDLLAALTRYARRARRVCARPCGIASLPRLGGDGGAEEAAPAGQSVSVP